MPEQPTPTVSLAATRERVIEELTQRFAHDDISLDQLETRLESVYRATTVAEVESLVADLRAASSLPVPASPAAVTAREQRALVSSMERDRFTVVMGESERSGVWPVPQHLDVYTMMAQTTIDLTHAVFPPDTPVIDIHVRALWTELKLIIPPGMRVANRLGAIMANVSTADEADTTPYSSSLPVIRAARSNSPEEFSVVRQITCELLRACARGKSAREHRAGFHPCRRPCG